VAAAVFFLVGALVFAGNSPDAVWIVVAAAAVVGAPLAVARRPRGRFAASLAVGLGLNAGALFLAFLLLLVGGSCSTGNGHVPLGASIAGAVVSLGGAAWALQRARRTWWGLPLATLVLVGLSDALTGSTGICLD
jgi:hypothetical protein